MAALGFLNPWPDAAARAEDPYELGEVVVAGEAPAPEAARVADRTAAVTVIRVDEHARQMATVPQLLEQSVGLTVRRFGGLGSFATASIRGSSAQQVAVLVDGVPVNGATSGVVNLSNLPLGGVERIEVYRGVAPVRLHASAIGGVINIVTRRADAGSSADASVTYGSFGTVDARATGAWQGDRFGLVVGGGYAASDGDFSFEDDNGTPLNPSDDEITTRENNDFAQWNALVKGTWTPGGRVRFELSNDHFRKDEGVPGISSNQSETARLRTRRNLLTGRAVVEDLGAGAVRLELGAFRRDQRTAFSDPDGEIGVGRQDNRTDEWSWGADAFLEAAVGEHHEPGLVLAYREERARTEDDLSDPPGEGDTQLRRTAQVGVQDRVYLWSDRVVADVQVLYDHLTHAFDTSGGIGSPADTPDDGGYWTSKAGVEADLGKGWRLRVNGGRYNRFPTFSELFGDRGTVIGNPGLAPENGVNADAGVSWDGRVPGVDDVHLEATAFASWTDDLILFVQTSQRTIRAENLSSARVRGVETRWTGRVWGRLSVAGNYTFQATEDTSDIPYYRGNQLPGRPEHEVFNRAELSVGRVRVFHELRWIGGNYLDRANYREVSARALHNLGLTVALGSKATLTLEGRNLTDNRITDVLGFPLPGRSYFATVRVEL